MTRLEATSSVSEKDQQGDRETMLSALIIGESETTRAVPWRWIDGATFASCRTFLIVLILGILAAVSIGQEQETKGVVKPSKKVPTTVTTESSLLPILEILGRAKLSGSLEFSGRCDSQAYPEFPEFPQIRTAATSSAATSSDAPLLSLRKLFAKNPKMHVTQDSDGTIRMRESNVPRDFLNLRVHHISFASPVFSANAAARYILSSPEVELFMKTGGINFPFRGGIASGIIGPGSHTSPHISGSIDDLTVSNAMDRILGTFPGIWIYEDCPRNDSRNRIVYFQFYSLQNTVDGEVVE